MRAVEGKLLADVAPVRPDIEKQSQGTSLGVLSTEPSRERNETSEGSA
jgi:hypothetical protein